MFVRLQSLFHGRRVLAALGLIVLGLLVPLGVGVAAAQDIDQMPPAFAEYESILWSATDASGAEVNYEPPRAWDDVDGEVGVECDYPPGTWFPLGDTLVSCFAQDTTGNGSEFEFYVSVVDTDAPALDDRDDIVVSTAADSAGAVVDYAPPLAHDNVDGDFEASCDILPGSYIQLGENEVACYAQDSVGNAAEPTYFFIVVVDDVPPALHDREDISASAADASGRVIEFGAPTAVDNVDGEVAASCDWASGAVFPLGQTEVTCWAADAKGNEAEPVSFLVTIYDDVAPTISPASNIEVQAGEADGDVVTFGVPKAWDDVSGAVGVGCDPASGAFFPVGTTTVTCYASDAAGNAAAPISFVVTVTAPPVPTATAAPTKAPTKTPTQPATGSTEPDDPGTRPTSTAPASATEPAETTPTPEPTRAVTSPTPSSTNTDESEPSGQTPAARPTAPAMELPFPPPGFVPITGSGPLGNLTGIWGYQNFGISQEFGHTAFSMSHSSWYAYGRNYGLDGRMHTGLDISMPAGTWLYSPVDGVVTVSGGTPYFTFYGNGNPGVGQLTITTAGGHQVILGHMARIAVGVGEQVQAGQFVGLSGGENGDHLHLETRERQRGGFLAIVDPRQSFLTGMAGTFSLSGGPAGDTAGKTVGGLVAQMLFESTSTQLQAAKPPVTATPPPTSSPTPRPGNLPTATPSPTQPPTATPTPTTAPTQPPAVMRPNPRPSNPPVVVRPNPPLASVGPVLVTNLTRGTVGSVRTPVSVVGTGAASSATIPKSSTTVVSVGGTGVTSATTITTTGTSVVTTGPAVVTTAVQPGVALGPAAIRANLPASRVKTPLVVTNPSLDEVDQPALSTLGPVPSALPGPTVATGDPTVVITAPTVVTTDSQVVITDAPTVTSEPQVVVTDPATVPNEASVEAPNPSAPTNPVVVVTEPPPPSTRDDSKVTP